MSYKSFFTQLFGDENQKGAIPGSSLLTIDIYIDSCYSGAAQEPLHEVLSSQSGPIGRPGSVAQYRNKVNLYTAAAHDDLAWNSDLWDSIEATQDVAKQDFHSEYGHSIFCGLQPDRSNRGKNMVFSTFHTLPNTPTDEERVKLSINLIEKGSKTRTIIQGVSLAKRYARSHEDSLDQIHQLENLMFAAALKNKNKKTALEAISHGLNSSQPMARKIRESIGSERTDMLEAFEFRSNERDSERAKSFAKHLTELFHKATLKEKKSIIKILSWIFSPDIDSEDWALSVLDPKQNPDEIRLEFAERWPISKMTPAIIEHIKNDVSEIRLPVIKRMRDAQRIKAFFKGL